MADKEERILCLKVDDKDFVYLPNAKNYKAPEGIYKVIIGGSISKQEAIEVMAKEIYKKRWIESECKNKNTLGFSICKDYAELALNALLEGGK